jgi:hypothetical protein
MVNTSADDNAISALSKKFSDISNNDIAAAQTNVSKVSITPGSFAEAITLSGTVQTRTGELNTYLANLKTTTDGISTDLSTVAGNYKSTDDENKMQASDIQNVIADANKNLPDLNKVESDSDITKPAAPETSKKD